MPSPKMAIWFFRTITATICVLVMIVVAATSMMAQAPPAPCDPEEGDCSKWGAVCCGPQCELNGVQTDYCLHEGPYDCCK
jgi:hypothetical protein